MHQVDINYLAVIVCGIFSMVLGFLWYGPLFGKLWMKEEGFTEEELRKDFNPAKTYGLTTLGHIIIAYVIARLMGYLQITQVSDAFQFVLLAWLGFTFSTMGINYLFEKRTCKLFIINSFYHLLTFLSFSVILLYWK